MLCKLLAQNSYYLESTQDPDNKKLLECDDVPLWEILKVKDSMRSLYVEKMLRKTPLTLKGRNHSVQLPLRLQRTYPTLRMPGARKVTCQCFRKQASQ